MSNNKHVPNPSSLVKPIASILTLIEREMEQQNVTLHQLAQQSGINRGLLSAIFTSIPSKPIPVRQLDLIGKVLGQPPGWLYELYVTECFASGKTHWKQIKNFLLRCVQLEKEDLITATLNQIMEEPVHIQDVFTLAESLFAQGEWKASIPFYRCICENEIKQHSERLATSHYKWFRARLGTDMKKNHEAALKFASYRNRLSENLQLDGLLQLANVHFNLQQWDEVIQYADEMKALLTIILFPKKERSRRGITETEAFITERHLVFYYGQSFLLKGNALEWMGDYEQALEYIAGYEDLSWFKNLDDTGWKEIYKFTRFAEANRYNLNVLMGHFDCLPEYLTFLDKYPEEWLPSLLTIMNAVNRFEYEADKVLAHFKDQIDELLTNDSWPAHVHYQDVFQRDRYARLCYELAKYCLFHHQYQEGIDRLLQALSHSIALSNKNLIINCAAFFEQYRNQALAQQKARYEHFMKGVIEDAQVAFIPAFSDPSL
ncbi:helix-turn-helix domain-containing protein [Paenibacillus silagei]|uniref:Transcriptional regulator with XRE-family HTH domain n=1 Tax=Paenibacillus silagei TaxID=1670801 RepID=A0ABS4NNM5_9BACL|nr:helix-turn-helix transcriptional regulator [Paenibacillus silagei]MBP2111641.1 transcriptional regulator with XRE-family HTH domain [Paenibacillus silagei]